jgi:hypothetical protein
VVAALLGAGVSAALAIDGDAVTHMSASFQVQEIGR